MFGTVGDAIAGYLRGLTSGQRRLLLVGGGLAVLVLIAAAFGGIVAFLICLALIALAASILGLVTRRRNGALFSGVRTRWLAASITASVVVFFVGSAIGGAQLEASANASAAAPAGPASPAAIRPSIPTASPTPTPAASWTDSDPGEVDDPVELSAQVSAPGTASDETALALLRTLTVAALDSFAGYGRTADFGEAWIDVDHNGCDTRDDILARDLSDIVKSGTCKVMSGTLNDPYTGDSMPFQRGEQTSALVQIDHAVSLGDAWQTGAQQLTQDQRILLANDPANLFAVDGRVNDQKGDRDAAGWLPPNASFQCRYIAAQVSIKATYHLWVTQPEHDAMQRVLSACPTQQSVVSAFAAAQAPSAAPAPAAAPPAAPAKPAAPAHAAPAPPAPAAPAPAAPLAPAPPAAPAAPAAPPAGGGAGVDPGGYCGQQGAQGIAANGKTYVCGLKGPDSHGKLHWNTP